MREVTPCPRCGRVDGLHGPALRDCWHCPARSVEDARELQCRECGGAGGFYDGRCWPCFTDRGVLPVTAPRRPKPPGSSHAGRVRLIEMLSDALGAPLRDADRGLLRWPCPLCRGGVGDHSELPYRPLVVADDGRVWCDAGLSRGYGSPMCAFSPKRLARALAEIR